MITFATLGAGAAAAGAAAWKRSRGVDPEGESTPTGLPYAAPLTQPPVNGKVPAENPTDAEAALTDDAADAAAPGEGGGQS